MEQDSGVFDELLSLPLYKKFIPYAKEAKQFVTVDFWTRQTLEWKLSCEQTHSRRDIIEAFKSVDKIDNISFLLIKFGAIVLGGFTALCWCCQCMCSFCNNKATSCKQLCMPIFVFFFAVTIQAGLIAAILYFSFVSVASNNKRLNSLSTLRLINECSDALTKLPASSIDSDLTDANR